MATQGYSGLLDLSSPATLMTWARRVREIVNNVLIGKINCTVEFTLTASAATSTLSDKRIGKYSVILFNPRTANAAADAQGGAFYTNAPGDGSVVVNHPNNANADKTFRVAIIG